MAAEGRALQAIEDLSALNRSRRDPRIERRLVELRHAASCELPTSGRPEWPPTFADPFPGESGLPVVEADRISGEVIGGGITNHGCLRVDHLVAPATVARIIEQIEQAFAGRDRLAQGADPLEVAPSYVPFAPGRAEADGFSSPFFVRVVDAPGTMWEIVELFEQMGVTAAVADYFGERPTMIANKWVLRRAPGGADGTDFHQDGAFLGEGIRTVNCWITLSECGPDTGRPGLEVIARRFDGIIPAGVGAKHTWSLAESTVLEAAPDAPVSCPVIGAGDAIFFDERTPHRTTNGPELGTRYAIESWFVAPSSSLARHEPIVL
jgi:Phytanoyl-CoA dioxygenase (PhyH)